MIIKSTDRMSQLLLLAIALLVSCTDILALPVEEIVDGDDEQNQCVPLHLKEDVLNKMNTLLSESNYQQQDLMTIKDDLGALKFGLASLQYIATELNEDSVRQNYKLHDIYDKLDAQDNQIDRLNRRINNFFTEVTMKLDDIIGSIDMCTTDPPTTQTTEAPTTTTQTSETPTTTIDIPTRPLPL